MICTEFKIWLDNTGNIPEVLSDQQKDHLLSCDECSLSYKLMSDSKKVIEEQKLEGISNLKAELIIDTLKTGRINRFVKSFPKTIYITKVAAVVIIAFGILIGIITGSFLLGLDEKTDNPWENEFVLLSDNSDLSLFE